VDLDPLIGSQYGEQGRTCRLHALPARTTPDELGRFRGPVLALSYFASQSITVGDNAGLPSNYVLVVAGTDRTTQISGFGSCGLYTTILDPVTLEKTGEGHDCSGSPVDNPELPLTG